jgi:hypothetical protein
MWVGMCVWVYARLGNCGPRLLSRCDVVFGRDAASRSTRGGSTKRRPGRACRTGLRYGLLGLLSGGQLELGRNVFKRGQRRCRLGKKDGMESRRSVSARLLRPATDDRKWSAELAAKIRRLLPMTSVTAEIGPGQAKIRQTPAALVGALLTQPASGACRACAFRPLHLSPSTWLALAAARGCNFLADRSGQTQLGNCDTPQLTIANGESRWRQCSTRGQGAVWRHSLSEAPNTT